MTTRIYIGCSDKADHRNRIGKKRTSQSVSPTAFISLRARHGSVVKAKCSDIAASPGIEPVHDADGKPLRQRTTTWDKQIPWFINPPSALIVLATWRSFRSNFNCRRQADKECYCRGCPSSCVNTSLLASITLSLRGQVPSPNFK